MLMLMFGPHNSRLNLQLLVGGELDQVGGELDLVRGELDLVGGELDLVGGELDLVGGELDLVQSKWGRTRWGRTRHGAKPADTLPPIGPRALLAHARTGSWMTLGWFFHELHAF